MAVEDSPLVAVPGSAIAETIANRAFVPVFQPIVDLATGLVVGYEALSRFDDGRAPVEVFAQAKAAGLDLDLELATLRVALVAARRLPGGRWLDINTSRRAIEDPRLASAISIADRRVVVEVDAAELPCCDTDVRDAVRAFGAHAGLAIVVDDPTVDFARDLEPRLVKLTRGLTARAATETETGWLDGLAERAPSAVLVAEGVETAEQARALARLGIELGQGHHFGSPALASVRPSAVN